jgi:hypothetical protein
MNRIATQSSPVTNIARTSLILSALLLLAGGSPAQADDDGRPVDLVFCLDVSGSMKDMLDATRAQLWDVVNEFSALSPTPSLRVGLLSYGDRESGATNGWIVMQSDLTRDLDTVYAKLMALPASGEREYVGRVLHAAVETMSWSEDYDALKIVFVAGNESADQGKEEFDFRDVVREAEDREILINTIYGGSEKSGIVHQWSELATLGRGIFTALDRSAKVQQVAAPQDEELQELNERLNATFVPYGTEGRDALANLQKQDANAAELGPQSLSSRIVTKSGAAYTDKSWDLVDAFLQSDFDLGSLPDEELPEELRGMSYSEMFSYLEEKRLEREEVVSKIRELDAERGRHIESALTDEKYRGRARIGDVINQAVRSQAEAKGFKREE